MDLLIKNGTIVTAKESFTADVAVKDGKIAAIGNDLPEAGNVVDASGKLVLPGAIDVHTHLAMPFGGHGIRRRLSDGNKSSRLRGV